MERKESSARVGGNALMIGMVAPKQGRLSCFGALLGRQDLADDWVVPVLHAANDHFPLLFLLVHCAFSRA